MYADEMEKHVREEHGHVLPDCFEPAKNVTWYQVHHLCHRLDAWHRVHDDKAGDDERLTPEGHAVRD